MKRCATAAALLMVLALTGCERFGTYQTPNPCTGPIKPAACERHQTYELPAP